AYFFGGAVRTDDYRVDRETRIAILTGFAESYDVSDDAQTWFSKVKALAGSLGFAAETKDYKANPEAYRGNVSDVAEVLRIAVTGRANTPDLWTIMQILGEEETRSRLAAAKEE
ncbi:MAG: glutamate--tRNA ligase, partial [Candidatus Gallimonas sp.]